MSASVTIMPVIKHPRTFLRVPAMRVLGSQSSVNSGGRSPIPPRRTASVRAASVSRTSTSNVRSDREVRGDRVHGRVVGFGSADPAISRRSTAASTSNFEPNSVIASKLAQWLRHLCSLARARVGSSPDLVGTPLLVAPTTTRPASRLTPLLRHPFLARAHDVLARATAPSRHSNWPATRTSTRRFSTTPTPSASPVHPRSSPTCASSTPSSRSTLPSRWSPNPRRARPSTSTGNTCNTSCRSSGLAPCRALRGRHLPADAVVHASFRRHVRRWR
jgi:hypothetical protein